MEPPGEDIVLRSIEPLLEGTTDDEVPRPQECCANCDSPLHGPYCTQCGQKAGNLEVTLGEFLGDAIDSLFSFDSRLWVTLRPLMARPAFLTVEFWSGRRARYMPPLRLYLFVSFLTFFTLSVVATVRPESRPLVRTGGGAESGVTDWEQVTADDPALLRWFLLQVVQPAVEEPDRTVQVFLRRLPWAVFALVPVMAALLRLAYRRQQRFLVPHLVFALHFHTFVFVLLVAKSLYLLAVGHDHLDTPINLWILIAFFLSLRRAYGESRRRTLLKMLAIGLVYTFALMIALLVSFVLSGFR